ncbi:MAG: leucine-rich repeat domain-containing protein [Muribaculaceae bacterium]|nr:leucine-rich repeat domain-containing protein [Muribaculaceae bacterium]
MIKHVVIERGITTVGSDSFSDYINIETVSLPEGLIAIENKAFYNCQSIKNITFPESLERIGDNGGSELGCVFYSCFGLEEITLPRNLKSIQVNSFGACRNIKTLNWNAVDCKVNPYNHWINNQYRGVFVGSGVETVNFGSEVKIVPDETFMSVSSLINITTKGSIEYVGNKAFAGTAWVAEQPVGEVVYIDNAAYMYTPDNSFDEIVIEFKPGTRGIRDYMFEGNNRLEKVVIPESVFYVGMRAFSGCQSLNEVVWNAKEIETIPENYKSSMFSSALRKITFGDNVTMLPGYFVYDCTNLKNIDLPESLILINESAFEKSGIKILSIPDNVEIIGYNAIYNCPNLEELIIGEGLKELYSWELFALCRKLKILRWNAENANIKFISTHFDIGSAIENCIFGNKVKRIPDNLFKNNSSLKNVTLGNAIEEIGGSAFMDCTSLEEIYFPSSLSAIWMAAFENTALEFIVIPENVKLLEWRSFHSPTLKDIVLLPLMAPQKTSAFYWRGSESFYVPDVEEYAEYKEYGEILPMAIPDNKDFLEGTTYPQVNFECNIPDYQLEIIDFPALETEVGMHKSLVTGRFTGRQNFDAKFVFEYEVHLNSDISLVNEGAGLVDIFNIDGMIIRRNVERESVESLPSGCYIIRQGENVEKLIVK